MDDKNFIGTQMKETLSKLSKPLYEDYSYKIASRLYNEPEWMSSKVIGITISKQPEVDTYQIIRKAWELEKKVVIPKCNPSRRRYHFEY